MDPEAIEHEFEPVLTHRDTEVAGIAVEIIRDTDELAIEIHFGCLGLDVRIDPSAIDRIVGRPVGVRIVAVRQSIRVRKEGIAVIEVMTVHVVEVMMSGIAVPQITVPRRMDSHPSTMTEVASRTPSPMASDSSMANIVAAVHVAAAVTRSSTAMYAAVPTPAAVLTPAHWLEHHESNSPRSQEEE